MFTDAEVKDEEIQLLKFEVFKITSLHCQNLYSVCTPLQSFAIICSNRYPCFSCNSRQLINTLVVEAQTMDHLYIVYITIFTIIIHAQTILII